jgi:sortase B
MFADLCKYTDADFCKEHPTIAFDTLYRNSRLISH